MLSRGRKRCLETNPATSATPELKTEKAADAASDESDLSDAPNSDGILVSFDDYLHMIYH